MDGRVRLAVVSRFDIVRTGVAALLATRLEQIIVEDVVASDGHLASMDVVLFDVGGPNAEVPHLLRDNRSVIAVVHDLDLDLDLNDDEHAPAGTATGAGTGGLGMDGRQVLPGVEHALSLRSTADELVGLIVHVAEVSAAGGSCREGCEYGVAASGSGHGGPAMQDYGLSVREHDVLARLALGMTNLEIADDLCLR